MYQISCFLHRGASITKEYAAKAWNLLLIIIIIIIQWCYSPTGPWPTERPPPVSEASANFCGQRGVTWSAQRIPTAVNLCLLNLDRYLFYSSSSSIDLTRFTRLSADPLPLRKSGSTGNRTWDLCICSQKPWPLHHRGGLPPINK